jgi:two-component system sensor histidine kinase YcbA
MIFIAIVDAIATQIFISILPGGFRVSLSVAILPAFYYLDKELNPLLTAVFISIVGIMFRTVVSINVLLVDYSIFFDDINIILFDLVYGLIFYYFYYKKEEKSIFNWIMIVFFADLFANTAELVSRQESILIYLNELIVVAFVRDVIALLIVLVFYYFINIFKKEIDRKKYYDLLSMFSDIKSEVYLMNNNVKYIENVMTDAYMLYDNIENENLYQNKNQALKIAQNVHEIKKNYLGILSGLSNVELGNDLHDKMTFYKILEILEINTNNFINDNDNEINLSVLKNDDFYVVKH